VKLTDPPLVVAIVAERTSQYGAGDCRRALSACPADAATGPRARALQADSEETTRRELAPRSSHLAATPENLSLYLSLVLVLISTGLSVQLTPT
ncbi:hypothetical protein J6590_009510, partial [Homalodisca vitripennis]